MDTASAPDGVGTATEMVAKDAVSAVVNGDDAMPTAIVLFAEGDMFDVAYVIKGEVFVVDCDIVVRADVCFEDVVADIVVSPERAAFGRDVALLSYNELLTKAENVDVT